MGGLPVVEGAGAYGKRADGTLKGDGYFGSLPAHGGMYSSEISVGVEIDGKEVEIPTMVPTLTRKELDLLLSGERPTDRIVDKAVEYARKRIKAGKSPFASPNERFPVPKD